MILKGNLCSTNIVAELFYFEQNIVILIEIELKKELLADFLYKMKFIFKEINMEIIIKKGNKVHYTTKLLDETGKIMVWKV